MKNAVYTIHSGDIKMTLPGVHTKAEAIEFLKAKLQKQVTYYLTIDGVTIPVVANTLNGAVAALTSAMFRTKGPDPDAPEPFDPTPLGHALRMRKFREIIGLAPLPEHEAVIEAHERAAAREAADEEVDPLS